MKKLLKTETLEYRHQDQLFEAYVAHPQNDLEKKPTVLVFHAWAGRDEFACKKADALAELGYLGVAVDLYGKGIVGRNNEENAQLMNPLIQDRQILKDRIHIALEAVKRNPYVNSKAMGAIGFCFGGLCALDLARSGADIRGVVSFHGLLNPLPKESKKEKVLAKVLALHGNDDPLVPLDLVEKFEKEMTEVGADWQLHTFGNTKHAFTNPKACDAASGLVFNELAERRSWIAMKNFFQEVL